LSGWPTPAAKTFGENLDAELERRAKMKLEGNGRNGNGAGMTTAVIAQMAGWPTPCQQDGPKGGPGQGSDRLPGAVALAGWPTPVDNDSRDSKYSKSGDRRILKLPGAVDTAGWPTPRASENVQTKLDQIAKTGSSWLGQNRGATVATMAQMAGWPTPTTRDHKDGSFCPNVPVNALLGRAVWSTADGPARLTVHGLLLTGSFAGTASGGQLNPAHSRWLMGYPAIWDRYSPGYRNWTWIQAILQALSGRPPANPEETGSVVSGDTETPSCPKSPQSSSEQP
jgi:hypothetical protein